MPKKEGDKNKEILTSPQVSLLFPYRVKRSAGSAIQEVS